MSLRQNINQFLELPIYMREHDKGWALLQTVGTCKPRKLENIRKDTFYNNKLLEVELEKSLDGIEDEQTVPKEVKIEYIDTPNEIIDLYKLQADLKGKQSALHATLENMAEDSERMEAAKRIITWQFEIDEAWDNIQNWKTNLVLPSVQESKGRLGLDINNKMSLISKTEKKIKEKPNHRLVPTWNTKIVLLKEELEKLRSQRNA